MSQTGAFDDDHPPQLALVEDCVHCGFCLPSCPTYELWGEEMDSPRGRIHLMKQGLEGQPLTAAMAGHFDRCLGCMACVSACPSGVQYDALIEQTRAQVERRHERSRGERLLRSAIFAVFPYPRRLRMLRGPLRFYQRSGLARILRRLGLLDRLPAALRAMEAVAPPLEARPPRLPGRVPAIGPARGVVGLLTGCVQSVFFPGVNAATANVLAAEGFDVIIPPDQGCCGALSSHMGRRGEAARFARDVISRFEEAEVSDVIVNAAGCGSAMKEYGRLLADDPAWAARADRLAARTRDVTEFLAAHEPRAVRHPLPISVAYHDACHLAHAQGIRAQPRDLLRTIPGLSVREIADGSLCCGSAGVYNLLQPEAAAELGSRKAARVLETGADLLVTANPGCLMQINAALSQTGGEPMPSAHTIEVLDAAVRGVPAAALLSSGTERGSPRAVVLSEDADDDVSAGS